MYLYCFRVKRQDIEEEDDQESYFNYIKNAPVQAYPDDDDMEIEYDSDGNPIVPEKSKVSIIYLARCSWLVKENIGSLKSPSIF